MPINNYCYLANGLVENVERGIISIIPGIQKYCELMFGNITYYDL